MSTTGFADQAAADMTFSESEMCETHLPRFVHFSSYNIKRVKMCTIIQKVQSFEQWGLDLSANY